MIDSASNTPNKIKSYFHCRQCIKEGAHPQKLEVGATGEGLQVWCKRHKSNVLHVSVPELEMLGTACESCQKGLPHQH